MGALKRLLMDDLIRERNTFAKRVMGDVREREAELRAARRHEGALTAGSG